MLYAPDGARARTAPGTTTTAAFDRGARRYDLLVALNPGYHAHLRSAAATLVERLGDRPAPWRLVDLACGSGASTRALLGAAPEHAWIEGLDASPGMLHEALAKRWPERVCFDHAVAGELPLDRLGRGTRDGILTAYLFRNVPAADRDRAVREVFELLAPGGWLVVQEYSVRGRRRSMAVWTLVCWLVIIPLGMVVDRNHALYRYLWRSVNHFDTTQRFMQRLVDAGFAEVATRTVPGWHRGILHTYVARRPESSDADDPAGVVGTVS